MGLTSSSEYAKENDGGLKEHTTVFGNVTQSPSKQLAKRFSCGETPGHRHTVIAGIEMAVDALKYRKAAV